ncbi:MAG: hypothetical protein JOZ51_12555 [Chloroflexi bacterium]|nr:hypothetical protein [Chloroflexota bacterium]
MLPWVPVSRDEAHTFFEIPREVASAASNQFFTLENNQFSMYDTWSLVSLQAVPDHPHLVAFLVETRGPKILDPYDYDTDPTPKGYVVLDTDAMNGLISLLTMQAETMPPTLHWQKPSFRRLAQDELPKFHIEPESFPFSQIHCYIQEYDPSEADDTNERMIRLVQFSMSKELPSSALGLSIARVSWNTFRLYSSYDPFEIGEGKVIVDTFGLYELIALLKHYQQYVQ